MKSEWNSEEVILPQDIRLVPTELLISNLKAQMVMEDFETMILQRYQIIRDKRLM